CIRGSHTGWADYFRYW
nr:immunoglobulin heavy chain junction region [Macaca mulatta]MOX00184.1 immunoglobulin heavy chain junction region [Macaca mulatta]MOX00389.1 immunoglobulin heavy chain junction region [Macaca mulatta]MOX01520.1 immunoglobulin heavy chain junction region [Macaca mulatta]MOX01805.1 immunoglobulin heavy chain junction region [Macaca mulatta]